MESYRYQMVLLREEKQAGAVSETINMWQQRNGMLKYLANLRSKNISGECLILPAC